MANPQTLFATVNHIEADSGILTKSQTFKDLVLTRKEVLLAIKKCAARAPIRFRSLVCKRHAVTASHFAVARLFAASRAPPRGRHG
jgi:hypothetical protein